jgi:hypothetical protein
MGSSGIFPTRHPENVFINLNLSRRRLLLFSVFRIEDFSKILLTFVVNILYISLFSFDPSPSTKCHGGGGIADTCGHAWKLDHTERGFEDQKL